MSDPIKDSFNPNDISNMLDQHPFDALHSGVSVGRTRITNLFGMGFANSSLQGEDFTFDTQPPLSFSQVSAKLDQHMTAIHHLVMIGYRYWEPLEGHDRESPKERDWEVLGDFDFEINVTENFDSPAFALKHKLIPPLSMYFAIYKGFVEHGTEMDFCFQLLAQPQVYKRVYFTSYNKTYPMSIYDEIPLPVAKDYILMGKTCIAYINAKRAENAK